MRKVISKIAIFLVGLAVLDVLIGFGCRYLVDHAKGGYTYLCTYICRKMQEECIVMGSSRGMHHYDPNIITDSLGMSCWNSSLDGNGIILMYGRYKLLSERYVPKVIIYDVCTSFDLLAGDDHKYLLPLRYYYDESSVDSIFWDVDKTERIKMMSSCYRYNGQWPQLILDNIHPLMSFDKGYRPVDKVMEYKPDLSKEKQEKVEYDSLKLAYLEKLVVACKQRGTKLVFAISPQYGQTDDSVYNPLKEICKRNGVPLLNHYCDKNYVFDSNLFYDSVHMNRTGATKYTKMIVGEVREALKKTKIYKKEGWMIRVWR